MPKRSKLILLFYYGILFNCLLTALTYFYFFFLIAQLKTSKLSNPFNMNRFSILTTTALRSARCHSQLSSRQLQLLKPNYHRTSSQNYHAGRPLLSHYQDPSSSSATSNGRPPVTILDIKKLWKKKIPITVLTAHDFISGKIADASGVDIVLVGDSLSMVSLGYENTNEIELDVCLMAKPFFFFLWRNFSGSSPANSRFPYRT